MTEAIHIYNPCIKCGGTDFELFESPESITRMPEGTPCIICKCKRFSKVVEWNQVNPKILSSE